MSSDPRPHLHDERDESPRGNGNGSGDDVHEAARDAVALGRRMQLIEVALEEIKIDGDERKRLFVEHAEASRQRQQWIAADLAKLEAKVDRGFAAVAVEQGKHLAILVRLDTRSSSHHDETELAKARADAAVIVAKGADEKAAKADAKSSRALAMSVLKVGTIVTVAIVLWEIARQLWSK